MNKNSKTFKKLVSAFMCTIIPCSNIINIKAGDNNINNKLKSENYEKTSGSWTKLLWLLVSTAIVGGTYILIVNILKFLSF